jgi:Zn-dependent protease with chaperone function
MATDFFDRQDNARRQTRRLVVMFALSVAVIVAVVCLVAAMIADGYYASRLMEEHPPRTLWHPLVYLWASLGTLLVIAVGSLYKISELAAGGESIALMLGGRAVNPQTVDLAERRLLNVVEEMALASGVPVPPVFVLDREPSINAFAAGHQPGNAVVAVSAGCLQCLTREELQGVIGHEFSHILNGDMRLNLRLIGVVNGILVLALIGYFILRSTSYASSRDSKDNSAALAIFVLGIVLVVLGYLGVFLGNLIKSAISRQREFLADFSSVQFTRNPGGLAGALKKIGGLSDGSRIRNAHAAEISHMFFGDAFAGSFFNLLATHPPLVKRIQALQPGFDGVFPQMDAATVAAAVATEIRVAGVAAVAGASISSATSALASGGTAAMPIDAGNMAKQIGRPQVEHLQNAGRMLDDMPPLLLTAAREPFAARAVVYAVLLSRDDEATRTKQMDMLKAQLETPLYQQTQQLAAAALSLPAAARLPLVDLTMPALKSGSPQQYAQFRQIVEALVEADGTVDLFEYCLRVVLFSYLDVHFGLKKSPTARYYSIGPVAQSATVVLSMLAYVGQKQAEEIQQAFQAGAGELLGQAELISREQCTLKAFDVALTDLAQASPGVKRRIIAAVTACIAADGQVTVKESELLRAIAAALGCPVPPLAATSGDA